MKIITDSGALYSPEKGKEIDIEVLPLHVNVNNKDYKELVDIDSQGFLEILKEGHLPRSSQPAIGETIEVLEKYSDEDVLIINMADGLSGTYQSTVAARESMDNADRIHVINSMTLCGPQKFLVDKAVALKNQGLALQDIIKEIHKSIATEKSILIPQDFNFLKRGGRLTPLAATLGGMMRIKPILSPTKDAKRLEKFAMKKTMKSAVREVIKHFQSMGVDEDYTIFITHAGVLEQAQQVKEQIQRVFEKVKIELYDLTPVFITQGGPGCIAIQTIK